MYFELNPYKHKKMNKMFQGRSVKENEKSATKAKEIFPLPAYQNDNQTVTIWKCNNIIARILFLFSGKINVLLLTKKPAPIAVSIGNVFV